MDQLWIQGVVRNGQVVLDTPLDLPDGTVVTVTDYDPDDDPRPDGPDGPLTPEQIEELLSGFIRRQENARGDRE